MITFCEICNKSSCHILVEHKGELIPYGLATHVKDDPDRIEHRLCWDCVVVLMDWGDGWEEDKMQTKGTN